MVGGDRRPARSGRPSWSPAASTAGGSRRRTDPVTVWVGWTAQRPLNAAIAVSLAAGFVAVVLVITDRRPRATPACAVDRRRSLGEPAIRRIAPQRRRRRRVDRARRSVRRSVRGPGGGWLGGAALVATRRIRLAGLVAVAALVRIAVDVVTTVRRDQPPATPASRCCSRTSTTSACSPPSALAVSALARRPPDVGA